MSVLDAMMRIREIRPPNPAFKGGQVRKAFLERGKGTESQRPTGKQIKVSGNSEKSKIKLGFTVHSLTCV